MAGMLADFVLQTANAPGTNASVELLSTPTGRRAWLSAFSTGAVPFYVLDDGTQAEWGYGAFTAGSPDTLSRDTVIGNTAGTTSRLNFTGSVRVYCALPAEKMVYLDGSGEVPFALPVQPGASGNEAVNYSQVKNAAPFGVANVAASATTVSATTASFTAPCNGKLAIFIDGRTDAASNAPTTAVSTSLAGGVLKVGGSNVFSALAELPMIAGQSTTVTGTFSNNTSGSINVSVRCFFLPLA